MKTLGETAHATYSSVWCGPGATAWKNLDPLEREAWIRAADIVVDKLLENSMAAENLSNVSGSGFAMKRWVDYLDYDRAVKYAGLLGGLENPKFRINSDEAGVVLIEVTGSVYSWRFLDQALETKPLTDRVRIIFES